jgi:hypothetical protein
LPCHAIQMVSRGCDLVCNAVCVACRCNNEGQCAELCELLRQTSKDWHDSVEALASRQTDTRQWTKRKSEAGASAASLDSLRSSYRVRIFLVFAFLPLAPTSTHSLTHLALQMGMCPRDVCVWSLLLQRSSTADAKEEDVPRVVSVGSTVPVEVVEEEEEEAGASVGGLPVEGGAVGSSEGSSEGGPGLEAVGSPQEGVVEAGPLSVVQEVPEGASSAVSTSSVSA